jgi:hypothetical protein
MNAILEDLWPCDLAQERLHTPASILKAQAAKLGQKTRNLVEGRVETLSREGRIYQSFILVAPALDNYSYNLFRISHPITMYPIRVEHEPETEEQPDEEFFDNIFMRSREKQWKTLESEEAFVSWLRSVLGSRHTKRVVDALVSQSSDYEF